MTPAIRAIIAKCLAPKAEDRYESAEALSDDLKAQACNLPLVHQPEPSLRERIQKWSRRHPRLASTASVSTIAGLCFAILIGMFVWRGNQLHRLEWTHRIDQLSHELPKSMALLTSLEVAPQLRPELIQSLHQTLSLCTTTGPNVEVIPGWDESLNDRGHAVVHRDLMSLIALLADRPWRSTPSPDPDAELLAKKIELQVDALAKSIKNIEPGESSQISEAIDWIKKQHWAEAKTILEEATRHQPQDYVAFWLLGDCYFRLGESERAIQAYSACIAMRQDIALAYFNRASVHFEQTKFQLSNEDFEQALRIQPNWQWARFNRAVGLQRMGKAKEAFEEINRAISAGVTGVSVYRLRAELYGMLGQPEKQNSDLIAALQCIPLTDLDWIDHGLILLGSDPKKASQDFEQALRLRPKSIDALQKLAYVHSELLGNRDSAIRYLDDLIQLAPDQATHRAGRAVLYARNSRWTDAIQDLETCEKLDPSEPMVQYQIASAYGLIGGRQKSEQSDKPTEQQITQSIERSIDWFTRSIRADSGIADIVATDPDMDSMKQLSDFKTVMNAVQILQARSTGSQTSSDSP